MTTVFEPRWDWYASDNGGETCHGPHPTREAAIAHGVANDFGLSEADGVCTFYVCEAAQKVVRLSDVIEVEQIEERAHDGPWEEYLNEDGDALTENVTPEQWAELEFTLKAAADAWQVRHGIAIRSFWFFDTRNEETVTVPMREVAT